MSHVDIDAILHGTADKRILLAYQSMKDSYNESTAEDFFNVYTKESLSDILNNSCYIFSECYKGFDFYKDIILNESSCIFTRLNSEYDKVASYFNENKNDMGEDQRSKFESFIDEFASFNEKYKDVILVASYANESEGGFFEKELYNALYNHDEEKVSSILKEATNDYTLYIYAPYVCESDNYNNRGYVNNLIIETVSDECDANHYFDNVVVMNRAGVSNTFKRDLSNLGNINTRNIIESFVYSEPITDTIKKNLKISDKDAMVVLHEDSHDAVNSIFNDILEASLFDESYSSKKEKANKIISAAYEKSLNLLTFESPDDNDVVKGYSLFKEGSTAKEIFEESKNKCNDLFTDEFGDDNDFFESSDEDDIDGELDTLANDIEKDDSESDSKIKKDDKKEAIKDKPAINNTTTKPVKPKARNLSEKIQTGAQDLEVKQMKAYANMKKHGADIGRAAKAVATLPKNVYMDIKNQINALHEKDIERRKAYMTEPGFRRKAFRNLKLSILYGTVAQSRLSMVPVLMIVRHFSKTKDKFIRKELEKDLELEIKICEAKIEDAQNNSDSKEKYRLMRIKDQLERERVRVLFNSKKM